MEEGGASSLPAIEADSSDGVIVLSGDSGSDDSCSSRGGKRGRGRHGSFRIQARTYALTYPKCPVERSVFDEEFKRKFVPVEFASAREQHKDGSYHLHVFVDFGKRRDVQSTRYFDLAFESITYHPNIQRCKSRRKWLDYISKGRDHGVASLSGDVGFDVFSEPLGKRKSMWQDYMWSQEHRVLLSQKPISFPIKLECEGKSYEMLNPDPRVKKRNWWIVAPPNAGKTRWLNKTFAGQRVYCPRTGPYPFEGYLDQDIVVYDDREGVSFAEFASVLNTWEIIQPVAGQVRYKIQNWKLGHTRSIIVLSNKTIECSMPEEDWQRMKKRFIQIVNPVLIPPEELSDDDEEVVPVVNDAIAQQFVS